MILAVCLQKGGVGKSTTALALGAELAALGARVLLVDMDPEADLTQSAGFDPLAVPVSMFDVMQRPADMHRAIVSTTYGFDLAPSTLALASIELVLASRIGRELVLRNALTPHQHRYDFIIVDTQPTLSLLTINGMVAANDIIVPLQAQVLALRALPHLEETVQLVRQLNPLLRIGGIVLTMTDRTSLSQAVEAEARERYQDLVFPTTIPRSTRVAEAPAAGQPIGQYAADSVAAKAYRVLARELLERYATE